ncbi:MAG: DUF4834 family protein [Bacteroidetes bacterium]|jgi:hypothetical protein|nr:DUF4834 family protein [Bacteroidota bacterium]MBT3747740.1 DUF4834 family protein [Bacteroidota bacterium]MBT4398371.1 DUF4834 family protein [Bacteroidota bacterium]MBT4409408.1 DUF4834 family protein [Bacteroidota bacterium]MBT7091600.1 DUF4834 family protein [Bacteroidota bacterium]
MLLLRYIAILVLFIVLVRFFRNLLSGSRKRKNQFEQSAENESKNKKIIRDDEGEYVDFEEMKKN